MDENVVRDEVETILRNLDLDNLDETTKEYSLAVTNVSKLHGILMNEEDLELKKSRNKFDEDIRTQQLEFEKKKWRKDIEQKILDRELDRQRLEQQHQERMAEIEVNRIKAENEKVILEQNQTKEERKFKSERRRDWLIFGGKALMLFTIVGLNVLMHKDELRFEREENGIVPQRCKTYDAVMNKAAEAVLK